MRKKNCVDHHKSKKCLIALGFACITGARVERHNLYVSLAPGVEQPQSVEPPPLNVHRCYMDVEDDHEAGAQADAEKRPVVAGQSKKRAESPQADKAPEDSTRKHCHMV
jgi:hypothetical protein